jgi:hypothetical protein
MAVTRITSFASLVEGYQHTDPKLYQILQAFVQTIGELQAEVEPLTRIITDTEGTIGAIPTAPTSIGYEILQKSVLRIYWSGATNAASYEVRKGTVWETAFFVAATPQLEVRLDPIATGNHTYLVRSRNGLGAYSTAYLAVLVTIPPIPAPLINAQVIDNNVLLRYSRPNSTWRINHYDVYRNNTVIGSIAGEFFVWFESAAGTFTYGVEAVDIAGNRSPRASVSVDVRQPPDFELEDIRHSLLAGYRVNALIYGDPELGWDYTDAQGWATEEYVWFAGNTGKLLVCVDEDDTWQSHFLEDGWDQPSDQTAAGFPIYIQPGATTALYRETIDYGGVFNNVIMNISWLLQQLTNLGIVSVTCTVETSVDGLVWEPPIIGSSVFVEIFRYARLTFNFVSSNGKALAIFSDLTISLDVKKELDSGFVNALAADVGGTQVVFNKDFKDVDSITVSPTKAPEPLNAIYEFIDVPNPTEFKVLVYDSIGTRVNCVCSWKARGIV